LESLQTLHLYLPAALAYWPAGSLSVAMGWLFVRLGVRWLPRPWLRWPAAVLIGAIAWIPFPQAPVGMQAAPFGAVISVFSVILMLAAVQTGREALLPASVWALIVLAATALALEQFGWMPWRLHALGYLASTSGIGQVAMLVFLVALVLLIALKRILVAGLALLPALLWRIEAAPSPNFWEAYIDLPLALVALWGLLRFARGRRPEDSSRQARDVAGKPSGDDSKPRK
jgi:hypothetical protein